MRKTTVPLAFAATAVLITVAVMFMVSNAMGNGCSQSGRSTTKGEMSGRIRVARIPLGSLLSFHATRREHFSLMVSPDALLAAFGGDTTKH
jgi:hypothetical protein